MMDAAERTLLEETVRAALAGTDTDADAVLGDVGWLEMLEVEPDDAVGIVFGALGASNGTATALDDVVVSALGLQPRADLAVLLPAFGVWDVPGRIDGATADALGLMTARVVTARDVVVVCATGSEVRARTVPVSCAQIRTVGGIDPHGGIHAVGFERVAGVDATLDAPRWEAAVAFGRRAVE
ncbi:MAG: hypothetical protein ACLPVY_07685 [Acidimicrobiia bacterium]